MPFGELLEQHRVNQTLVALRRERLAAGVVTGVVRQFSRRLILVEGFAAAGLVGEGFTLIRREDLTRVDQATHALRQLLRTVGPVARSHPIAREVDLAEWRTALESLGRVTPALTVQREGVGDPLTLAAPSLRFLKHLVLGQHPDPTTEQEGEFALALDQITRIDFR